MSVELDPPELGFQRPFSHEVSQFLRLYNKNSDPVAFKVKTTAPKQYCVRPNSGRIEPGEHVEVQVLLQAMKEDPPLDAKCKDKFLVQSVAISADKEFPNVSQIWSHIEQTAKSSIQEKKIRVVFLSEASGVNGVSNVDNSYSSPSPQPQTPQRNSEAATTITPSQHFADSISGSAYNSTPDPSTMSATAQRLLAPTSNSTDQLQAQLAEAQATISQLRKNAEDSGLRQRKTDAINQDSKERITTGTTGLGVQKQPASGVPVQVAAGLCLLCFLVAYFFF